MKEKIAYLMESEGLTTTRLAEILETQPSAVSHLVSGRNKPSYDLLQKILRRFPRINPDWLLLDSDTPYRIEQNDSANTNDAASEQLAESADFDVMNGIGGEYRQNAAVANAVDKEQLGAIRSLADQKRAGKSPIFVVVFYDDGSCENFSMR